MSFPPRRVLLAVQEKRLERRLFTSAAGLAKRMNAGLEILVQGDRENPPALLAELLQLIDAEEVPYRLTWQTALSAQEVVRYGNTHECVTCVVIDTPENWGGPANVWEKLACPLVVSHGATNG